MAERTGLPKASVSRLTASLASLGYLNYDRQLGRYSIGSTTVSLGYVALSSIGVVRRAIPLMQEISDRTSFTVVIGAQNMTDIVCLSQTVPSKESVLQFGIGSFLPIWRTALGLAFLAEVQDDVRDDLVKRIIAQENENRETIRSKVAEAIKAKAECGFVMDFGSWYGHINSVGIAFRPKGETALLAVACFGMADLISHDKCASQVGSLLAEIAERV